MTDITTARIDLSALQRLADQTPERANVTITQPQLYTLTQAVRAAITEAEDAQRTGRDGTHLIEFLEALTPFRPQSRGIYRYFTRTKPAYLPGLREEGEEVDVTSFNDHRPIRFRVEGKPAADDFLLSHGTWERLGQPDRIRVTVEATERPTVPQPVIADPTVPDMRRPKTPFAEPPLEEAERGMFDWLRRIHVTAEPA